MTEEQVFIKSILRKPSDAERWLQYAGWLESQGQIDRAAFLTLTAELIQSVPPGTDLAQADAHVPMSLVAEVRRKLTRRKELAQNMPAEWFALFDQTPIRNCGEIGMAGCPRHWHKLAADQEKPLLRNCGACEHDVHYCTTAGDFRRRLNQGSTAVADSRIAEGLSDSGIHQGAIRIDPHKLLARAMQDTQRHKVHRPHRGWFSRLWRWLSGQSKRRARR